MRVMEGCKTPFIFATCPSGIKRGRINFLLIVSKTKKEFIKVKINKKISIKTASKIYLKIGNPVWNLKIKRKIRFIKNQQIQPTIPIKENMKGKFTKSFFLCWLFDFCIFKPYTVHKMEGIENVMRIDIVCIREFKKNCHHVIFEEFAVTTKEERITAKAFIKTQIMP